MTMFTTHAKSAPRYSFYCRSKCLGYLYGLTSTGVKDWQTRTRKIAAVLDKLDFELWWKP